MQTWRWHGNLQLRRCDRKQLSPGDEQKLFATLRTLSKQLLAGRVTLDTVDPGGSASVSLADRIATMARCWSRSSATKERAQHMTPILASDSQVWALYKEVQGYYEKGMRVPDDVTLLWSDDNWGNIRWLPLP